LRTSWGSTSDTTSNENWSLATTDTVPAPAARPNPTTGPVGPDAILAGASGRVPERPKGAVCKIAGVAYAGSNPAPPTEGCSRNETPALLRTRLKRLFGSLDQSGASSWAGCSGGTPSGRFGRAAKSLEAATKQDL